MKKVNCKYSNSPYLKFGFYQKIKSRTKNGIYYNRLKGAYHDYIQNKDRLCKTLLLKDIVGYFFGSFVANSLFKTAEFQLICEYDLKKPLYHFTDVANTENIKKYGIIPDKDYVFLIDDVDYFIKSGYLEWKTFCEKKDIEFCVLPIDTENLSKKHKIYKIDRSHEFVVEKIESEYILF